MKQAIQKMIEAVENYDPTQNGDVNCVITEGLIEHLKNVAKQLDEENPDWLINAHYYLSDSDKGLSIREQVELIAEECSDEMIDNIAGVCPWYPLEDTYTCEQFLELINY